LQEVFGAMPRSRIALEIGTHSPWISRLLSALFSETRWRQTDSSTG
jgi:transposase